MDCGKLSDERSLLWKNNEPTKMTRTKTVSHKRKFGKRSFILTRSCLESYFGFDFFISANYSIFANPVKRFYNEIVDEKGFTCSYFKSLGTIRTRLEERTKADPRVCKNSLAR